MTVAKVETQRVVSDFFPARHRHSAKILFLGAAVLLSKNVFLSARFRARRGCAQFVRRKITLRAIVPDDGNFAADKFYFLRRLHDERKNLAISVRQKRRM